MDKEEDEESSLDRSGSMLAMALMSWPASCCRPEVLSGYWSVCLPSSASPIPACCARGRRAGWERARWESGVVEAEKERWKGPRGLWSRPLVLLRS